MKISNKYDLTSTINLSANFLGKGLELLKNKIFNNKEEKGAVNGNSVMECSLCGEMSVEISTEELIELYKEYGDDFSRQVKFLKEELRPITKEVMAAIDDSAKSILKTIGDCEKIAKTMEEEEKKSE